MDDALPPFARLRELTSRELAQLTTVRLNFAYNFAEPPYPEIHWELRDLLQHARFPMAAADYCDKWVGAQFSIEDFGRWIKADRVAEPGHLSALTIGKLVGYCLEAVEVLADAAEALGLPPDFNGEDLLQKLRMLARPAASANESPWSHFLIATRHPVIRWAVNNAVMNRWGTRDFPSRA